METIINILYHCNTVKSKTTLFFFHFSYSTVIIRSLVLGPLVTLFCIFLNSKITSFSIYFGSVLAILSTTYSIIQYSIFIKLLFFYCLQLTVLIVCIISLLKIDKSILFDVIKDSCR